MRLVLVLPIFALVWAGNVQASCCRRSSDTQRQLSKKEAFKELANVTKYLMIGQLSDAMSVKLPNGVTYRFIDNIHNIKGQRTLLRRIFMGQDGVEKLTQVRAGIVSRDEFTDMFFPIKDIEVKELTDAQSARLKKRVMRQLGLEDGSIVDIQRGGTAQILDITSKEGKSVYERLIEVPETVR